MYKVKEYREKKKWSQELLAEKSGVSRATIASLEAPDSEITTTTSTLIKIATALECRVSDIFLSWLSNILDGRGLSHATK